MVHGTRRKAKKMRDLRCKSADSGVSCTLNKNLLQQDIVQSSRIELNGLDEEDLDFEPEFTNYREDQSELHVNSDDSTIQALYSDDRNDDYLSIASVENASISTVSIGHRRDMLPIPPSDAEDGRQSDYLPFTCSTTRTLIDSSSDDDASSCSNLDDNSRSISEGDLSRDQNISYSGDLDRGDIESICDMTREEEERLLGSSNEATDEDEESVIEPELTETFSEDAGDEYEEPQLEKTGVETCHFGNARITLPKFFVKNDLKRTTSTARQHKMQTKKKKKWDLRYTPVVPPTRLFLDDLGFVENSSSDEDDKDFSNSNSVDSVSQLIVICNDKEKVVCEASKNNIKRENFQASKSEDDLFKLPLPPPKRPPTRPKRMGLVVSESQGSGKNLLIKVSNKHAGFAQRSENSLNAMKNEFSRTPQNFQDGIKIDKFDNTDTDDTISIIASTIGGDNNEDISNLSQSESLESSPFEYTQLMESNLESHKNLSLTEERIQNWIQNVPGPESPPLIQQEDVQLQPGKSTVAVASPNKLKGNNRVYFKDIPSAFGGICYYHFFNGICTRRCILPHSINRSKFKFKFQQSNPEAISKAYDFALEFENLFKEIYPSFFGAFSFFKMQKKLVASIEDIFKMDSINKTEALEIIVESLEGCGLSFLETIEVISFNVGFLQYPELGDILLDLITRNQNISENWEVIKKIGKARGQISPDIVKRILVRVTSVYPLNKRLCLEIYNVIIKNEMTNLSQISEEHLAPLRTLAGFRDTADPLPKQTVIMAPMTSVVRPLMHNTEQLAAHIDNSLIKERERFEREAERNVRTNTAAVRPSGNLGGNYVSSYDYDARIGVTNYDNNFHHGSDSDERYFIPNLTQETFLSGDSTLMNGRINNPYVGGGIFSASSSSMSNEGAERNTTSPPRMVFEPPSPPEVIQYVPETVRKKDVRGDPATKQHQNRSPQFQPPRDFDLPPFRHQDLDITLTPSRPIFGNPRYRSDFQLDRSLHNLLPDTAEHVNINEKDIVILNEAIKSKHGYEFYRLLKQYKSPATLQNFITMTIAHLKTCNGLYEIFVGLVESLEMLKPDYAKVKFIKAVLEVVVMNLLFEFERKGLWFKARKLLEKFCDWDSLISAQIFASRRVTTMGRYIFLAKIFGKSQNFHYTYEILQCPSLHLLESCDQWPYFYNAQADLEQRNSVLTDFFQNGYRCSIVDVSDMYRKIYRYGGIHGYDAQLMFNPMLIKIMNEQQQTSKLKHFYPDIDVYYKVMDKNVLRAFVILISNQVNQEELYSLYEMCSERQIYTYFQGGETNITVRVNMLDIELQLILNYYFYKISKSRRLPVSNVLINIKLQECQVHYPKILQNTCRSISVINMSVKHILRDNFNIFICDTVNSKLTDIEINSEQIKDWLQAKDRYCLRGYW